MFLPCRPGGFIDGSLLRQPALSRCLGILNNLSFTHRYTVILSCRHDRAWLALHVRTGRELTVAQILESKGYEKFVPLSQRHNGNLGHNEKSECPLFPGYVFVRFNSQVGALIVTTPFVIRILGTGNDPSPINESEIDALRMVQHSSYYREPCTYMAHGTTVRLHRGPLAGLQGIVVAIKNEYRLVISMRLLQRSAWVEVDRNWLEPETPVQLPHGLSQTEPSNYGAAIRNSSHEGM